MKIHEYQAKEILRKYGVPVPGGEMAMTIEQAETAAKSLFSAGNAAVVVKAQIHAGGRGKGGGVKVVKTLDDAVAFYADVKGRMAEWGRHPDELKIMPGVFPVVGRDESEAREKFEALQQLIDPVVGLALVSGLTGGFDLSPYPLDGPIPELPETNASKSRQALTLDLARRENLTIRQLALRVAGARGHWQLIGTPKQIADALEERFVNYGADGFNVMAPTLPGGLEDFVTLVLPELRRRGLFRDEYEGTTLRQHLGLARPARAERVSEPGVVAA